eukprot:m.231383 g.231383  ORF g.231383 m.231383 type:complete len:166 (-) comp15689_c0_seq1:3186-3683(-)
MLRILAIMKVTAIILFVAVGLASAQTTTTEAPDARDLSADTSHALGKSGKSGGPDASPGKGSGKGSGKTGNGSGKGSSSGKGGGKKEKKGKSGSPISQLFSSHHGVSLVAGSAAMITLFVGAAAFAHRRQKTVGYQELTANELQTVSDAKESAPIAFETSPLIAV